MAWDSIWETIFQNQEWGQYPGEALIRFVARNFYKKENRAAVKILEVGCGPGANLWYMLREGFSVVGIDGSKTAVEHALQRLEITRERGISSGHFSVIVGDISHLPFADATFDAVVDVQAVSTNSYRDAQSMYLEMARVTKPGGKCYSQMFAEGIWGCTESGEAVDGPLVGHGYKRITHEHEISELMQGWQNLNIDLQMRTLDGFQHNHWFKEWIVTAEKV